jgi:hypothetical protein
VSCLRNYCIIHYVRYNNDFILGLRVEKKMAKAFIGEIQVFLKSDLHME